MEVSGWPEFDRREDAIAFCAACASRVAPLFVEFAAPPSSPVYDDCLSRLWESIVEADPIRRGNLRAALIEQIESLPEAQLDDSADPTFYATRALGVLFMAVSSLTEKPETAARRTANMTTSLMREVDALLEDETAGLLNAEVAAERSDADRILQARQLPTPNSARQSEAAAVVGEATGRLRTAHQRAWGRL
jgi:hypothetical protein